MEKDVLKNICDKVTFCLKNEEFLRISKKYDYFVDETKRISHSCKFKFKLKRLIKQIK